MKPREIKAEIIRKGLSLTDIAAEAESSLAEVSRCISDDGLYLKIRKVIAKRLGTSVKKLFADHKQPQRRGSWCKAA